MSTVDEVWHAMVDRPWASGADKPGFKLGLTICHLWTGLSYLNKLDFFFLNFLTRIMLFFPHRIFCVWI